MRLVMLSGREDRSKAGCAFLLLQTFNVHVVLEGVDSGRQGAERSLDPCLGDCRKSARGGRDGERTAESEAALVMGPIRIDEPARSQHGGGLLQAGWLP